MANDDRTGLSAEGAPTAGDAARVESEIARFNAAAAKERVDLFEGPLRDLAAGIAQRYNVSENHEWIVLLGRISEATSLMAAEDINSIIEEFLVETPVVYDLRRSRYSSFAKEFIPDPSIYVDVDTDGCRIVVACDRFQLNGSGRPIFEGTMELLEADMTVVESFDISMGGGSESHTKRYGPLPPGRYLATNFRIRDATGMVRDGVGYSVNLDPCDGTTVYGRDAFRIHPDGAPFGTLGCVGVLGDAGIQRSARDLLREMVSSTEGKAPLKLCISYTQ